MRAAPMAVYKRKIFLINPRFQYKVSLMICIFAVLATVVYPLSIYGLFERLIELQPQQGTNLANVRNETLTVLGIAEAAIIALIFLFSIFLTHKIAGPMYKLSNHLKEIRGGKEITPLSFRKGDYFHEVAQELNETLMELDGKRKEDFQYLSEVASYITNLSLVVPEDKKPVLKEIQSKLAEIQSRS